MFNYNFETFLKQALAFCSVSIVWLWQPDKQHPLSRSAVESVEGWTVPKVRQGLEDTADMWLWRCQ